MTNETQPFDQDLYDKVMDRFPAYDHADPPNAYDVWEGAADIAATIAAARQPAPVPGDEELALIFARAYWLEADAELPDELKDEAYTPQPPTLAGIRAVREALAAQAVQVPDGTLTMAVRWGGDHNMKQWTAKIERRIPGSIDNGLKTYFGYHPTEPMQALSAALEKAKGGS